MTALARAAALARREEDRDHAEHLVRMLRVTLAERINRETDRADSLTSHPGHEEWHMARVSAYRDVLSLLGPEEPTDTSGEPF